MNPKPPTYEEKLAAAKAYAAPIAKRPYSSVPTVLLPVAQRRVQREQERRT